ncbi:MFS transporter [Nocardioides sp.]|uniref:MFS transporter n=1 Tax=Nocardioides sp. TaxID=35761 RepID=UPI002715E392|nr:MFS transporter [Nocardioides sp.]MDO9457235.1 MFS transporter [Nocardioides sp.]
MAIQSQRTRLVTLVLVGSAFLSGIDLFIVNVAFDDIGRDFAQRGEAPSLSQLSWVLNAYAVVFAALLVPMGRLTDRYGRKAGFVAGLVLFTVASAACGFSTDVWQLVGFRGLQAVGAAAMTPASLGLLLAALPVERKAPAARLWALTGALAAALGPAVGGGLVQLSWHWAFWINLPIGVLLVVGAVRFVPDVRHNAGAPRPDLAGAALVALAVGALVLGLVQGGEWGWSSAGVVGSFVVAVVAVGAFAWLTTHHASPVIDPSLLRVRAFSWASVTTLVFNAGFGAGLLGGILWMQQVWGYSALKTGLAVALGPLLVPVTSILVHRVLPRVRPGTLSVAGCLVAAGGAAVMATSLTTTPSYWTTVVPGWALTGIAVGLAMPNLVASATSALPPEQASTGGGVVTMARQVGLVLGVSVLVAIVGSGVPSIESFRAAWWVVAAASLLAAATATAIESRPVRVADPAPATA